MTNKKSWRPANKITAEQIVEAAETFVKATSLRFEWYKAGREYRWRLKGANNEIVASGESYKTKRACLAAVALVQSSAQASVEEVEN
jgi:uncharacterized protein